MNNADKLRAIIETNGIDIEKVRVLDAEIVSVNFDNTVNIVVAGVPILRLPSDRKKVGQVKAIRTADGQTFVV